MIGHTASGEGLDVDALVFVGSPGVGVNNVSELNFPPDQVYATVAENGIIHLANMENPEDIHEMDPTDPDFGAQVFEWGQDNKALEDIGLIIAGEQTT